MLPAANLAALPHVAHGFFGREGGVSEGLYASLNCGLGSGDDMTHIRENRRRVAEKFGCKEASLCTLYQIHSAAVHTLTRPFPLEARPEGDALVTATPGIILGILTADCGPVLFADAQANVIGAAHAGWKGALTGVLEETISAMEKLGAKRGRIAAALGPCIAQASYEVGPEFVERFTGRDPGFSRFFTPQNAAGKAFFDLKACIRFTLEQAGIANLFLHPADTCAEEKSFFSYRRTTLRAEPVYGREISCIMLR